MLSGLSIKLSDQTEQLDELGVSDDMPPRHVDPVACSPIFKPQTEKWLCSRFHPHFGDRHPNQKSNTL